VDGEGVEAQRVDVVSDGRLQAMLMSRTPTRDFKESNGHGRSAGAGRTRAAVGCLFVEAADGLADEELMDALLEAVDDQGLEYGLRVTSIGTSGGGANLPAALRGMARMQGGFGGGGAMGDPIGVYKVYLDGRQEPVRGCEFGSVDVGTLKDIIAAGRTPVVYNTGSAMGSASSFVAPAVLFEELELFMIEEELQRLPIMDAPHQRPPTGE
jgi:hypothetical protein